MINELTNKIEHGMLMRKWNRAIEESKKTGLVDSNGDEIKIGDIIDMNTFTIIKEKPGGLK